MVLLSMNFHRVPRDVSQGPIPELIPFPIYTWLMGCKELSASLQMTPNWGERAVEVLEDFVVQRDIQKLEEWASRNCKRPVLQLGRNNLRTGVQAAKCTLDGFPESKVCKSLERDYSPLLSCLTWYTMPSFGMPPVREMLTKWNELLLRELLLWSTQWM